MRLLDDISRVREVDGTSIDVAGVEGVVVDSGIQHPEVGSKQWQDWKMTDEFTSFAGRGALYNQS
jgi:hypothetical protein